MRNIKHQSVVSVVGLLIAFFGMVFWLDGETVKRQRQVLGEKVVNETISEEQTPVLTSTIMPENSIAVEESTLFNNTADSAVEIMGKATGRAYKVMKIVDGDTFDVDLDGQIKRVRLIGINTPESVDPRKAVECFSLEAADKLRKFLSSGKVYLKADETQSERDIYGRLLRYAWNIDQVFVNEEMIKQGYAYEYTYKVPYQYQADFKLMQRYAQELKLGLWAEGACEETAKIVSEATPANSAMPDNETCVIKGNISFENNEKIYHNIDCPSYDKTKIDLAKGEQYFCFEEEALAAGWRKADNCP